MPALPNARQERFAQLLAAGAGNLIDCYTTAGYKRSPSSASQMAAKPHIRERVAELTAVATVGFEIDAQRVVSELANVGLANLRDVASWGENGVVVADSGDLPPAVAAAVKKVRMRRQVREKDGETSTEEWVELELHDKLGALDKLSKVLRIGGYGDPEDRGGAKVQVVVMAGTMGCEAPPKVEVSSHAASGNGRDPRAGGANGNGKPGGQAVVHLPASPSRG
jgi:hypothetical protein